MPSPVDISGQQFGRLTATHVVFVGGERKWLCECKCGGTTTASVRELRSGGRASCKCYWNGGLAKNCLTCGVEFTAKNSRSHSSFCSHKCYWKSKVGVPRSNVRRGYSTSKKGKKFGPLSDETKKKMSESWKRRKGTPRNRKYPRGEDHPQWKGGSGTERHRLMRSVEYKNLVASVLRRDDYTCQICARRGVHLHVDHIQKWSDFPDLRFVESNCRTLCRQCHFKVTFGFEMPAKSKWGITARKAG